MRLICPNCGAQYEVPESVIPETGRDVQCSSCGHTWFQSHPQHDSAAQASNDAPDGEDLWDDADDDDDESLFGDDDRDGSRPATRADAPPSATQEDEAEDEWEGFPSDPGLTDTPRPAAGLVPDPEDPVSRLPEVEEDDYEEDPARDLPPPRRGLDTSVADLLREEAEREARARAAERGPGLESQPDLGLDSGPAKPAAPDEDALRRQEEARLRMARLRGEDPVVERPATTPPPAPPAPRQPQPDDDRIAAAAAAAVADSRRGLLPDIEEINSSLRSTSDRRPARADDHDTPGQSADPRNEVTPEGNRGFSRGFSVTFLIAMLLLALYIFAPALVETLPAAAPAVDAYVAAVDQLRLALDAQVQNLSRWLAEVAGSTG